VIDTTTNALMEVIDARMRSGTKRFTILISSPGGSVFHGLSAYNYLKGLPADVVTHNFGSVDSIGVVLYCAGSRRLAVPQSRFLLHGVSHNIPEKVSLEEKQLEERLKGLKIDVENIAKVIAANTGKSDGDVRDAMLDRTTLNPEEAKRWGLVHEINANLFEAGSEVFSIHWAQQEKSEK